jgi:carbohydrate kinase (thermoresistant glucokinase family)
MPRVPGLRSNYARVSRLVYFGRMLDKIHLHAAANLPADYHSNLGIGFDGRCCSFLGVSYAALKTRVLQGGTDSEILAWCHEQGGARTDDQCNIFNRFLMKLGWRDDRTPALRQRIAEFGLAGKPIETFFDLNEFDEGRNSVATRAWELRPPVIVVITGVSGTGKTTVGQALAAATSWDFRDADEFHPPANIEKMASGHPLDDTDREPWLASIRDYIASTLARGESAIVTCSALKESYRQTLGGNSPGLFWVYLHGTPELLRSRLTARPDHFMKADMLDSQLAALEPPAAGLSLDVSETPDALVAKIREQLGL